MSRPTGLARIMADPAMNRQRYAATRYQWTRPVRGQSGRVHCPLVRASRITSARNSGGYSGLLFGRWTPPLGPHPQIYRRPGHRVNITEGDNNAVGAGKGPLGSLEKETPSGHVLHCRMLAVKAPGVYGLWRRNTMLKCNHVVICLRDTLTQRPHGSGSLAM